LGIRLALALPISALALLALTAPHARSASTLVAPRWTAATPDDMVDQATARALSTTATEHGRAAAIATIATLADRAANEHAKAMLERIAAATEVPVELRGDAALLARNLSSDEGTEEGGRADRALGVIDELSILGPFRDTGGGLDTRDGPELAASAFDPSARYSWGSYDVVWRSVPRTLATARGVPLDLFVFPRKESCTWLATQLVVERAQALTVSAAAAGQIRLLFDGHDVARDDSAHESMRFDRIAAHVEMGVGRHLLAAKVCSGAIADDGRVRLRVTNDAGKWPADVAVRAGPWEKDKSRPKAPAARPMTTPLGRAIDKPASDIDARLDAAVLRTLGGADDLRSPRAPGVLASLADEALDPDRLALAAWIAPSGANQSGWLNRARGQADPDARAFIDRRLVERHLDAHLADWAMASMRGAKIAGASDAEAALLSARVDAALGTEVLRVRAMRRLAAVADAAPKSVPDAVLEQLARLAEGLDPGLALRAREQLSTRGDIGVDLVRLRASTKGRADTVRAAQKALAEGAIDDADDAIVVAQAVARTGARPYGRESRRRPAR
jgi:hypothetical protein